MPIGGWEVPSAGAGEARQLRGEFLRYLLLGGCEGLKDCNSYVHEKGVRLSGALISGVLDLEGCRIPRDIVLLDCLFLSAPVLLSAVIDSLFLNGSTLPGLRADRLKAKGAVSMSGVQAEGAVRLLGAKLGGDLDCDDARLKTLLAAGVQVEGTFFLRGKARITGDLDLSNAQFGALNDETACWPQAGNLVLNRCQYGAITNGPVTAAERIKWLSLQDEARWKEDFWPQPWEQCAKVLREMGHREEARTILIEKEKRQRADRRKRLKRDHLYEDYYWHSIWDRVLGLTVRYGRQPLMAFAWLFALWAIGIGVFGKAEQYDAIKPNDVRILRSAEWADCAPTRARNEQESHLECFLRQPEAASYPQFNPAIYSADTLLPIVALEMQSFWIPDDRNGPLGEWARYFLWFQIIMGWGLSLLAVAGFSGLIKSD